MTTKLYEHVECLHFHIAKEKYVFFIRLTTYDGETVNKSHIIVSKRKDECEELVKSEAVK